MTIARFSSLAWILFALAAQLLPPDAALAKVGFRQLTSTHPVAVQRGQKAEVKVRTNFTLDETHAVFVQPAGVTMKCLETEPIAAPRKGRGSKGTPFRFEVASPESQQAGVYEFRVATKQAVSSVGQLLITDHPVVLEEEAENGAVDTAQVVEHPVAIAGRCEKFEDVDNYRFRGEAGKRMVIQVYAQRVTDRIHSMVVRGPRIYLMDPILTLIGPNGQVVAQNDNYFGGDSLIDCKLPVDGDYTLEVRDARYAGDPRYSYCVEISSLPFAYHAFPPAIQTGKTSLVELVGLGDGDPTRIELAATESEGWSRRRFPTPAGESNPLHVKFSPHPQIVESENNDDPEQAAGIEFPSGLNGHIQTQDDIDYFGFDAEKGEAFEFEVEARRYGSPLDSVLEIYDSAGKLLGEADDLANQKTKDSRLKWTAKSKGKYFLAIRDLHDRGGEAFFYHLRAERAKPDFELFGEYYYAMLAPGVRMMWFARVERRNGFQGPVAIEVEGLPAGVTATPVTIPAGVSHCGIILSASDDAPIGAALARVKGRAEVAVDGDKREIVRYGRVTCEQQSSGGGQSRWPILTQLVGVTKPLDLKRVTATPESITLKPGGSAEIEVSIERQEGFKDAVTLDMAFTYFKTVLGSQLPPGVTMSSKSKARLAGDALKGKIVLEANDKATPVVDFPIAVVARVSITFSITTNYASNPILLTVEE